MSLSIPPKGKLVNFKPLREEWSDYSLADGTVLRVKVIVTKILRVHNSDGSPMFTPAGEPVYNYGTQNVSYVLTPSEYNEMVKTEVREV